MSQKVLIKFKSNDKAEVDLPTQVILFELGPGGSIPGVGDFMLVGVVHAGHGVMASPREPLNSTKDRQDPVMRRQVTSL